MFWGFTNFHLLTQILNLCASSSAIAWNPCPSSHPLGAFTPQTSSPLNTTTSHPMFKSPIPGKTLANTTSWW